jgi:Co/Zn/Cd efflux system component
MAHDHDHAGHSHGSPRIVTAIAGAVILATGFRRADGIASPVVAAVMLRAAYQLLKASGRVFLEAAPPGVDPDAIRTTRTSSPLMESATSAGPRPNGCSFAED